MRYAFLVLAVGCATYSPFKPAEVTAPPDAFTKTTRVLIERGESVETKDEAAGILVTKWNEEHSGGDTHRFRWSITIAAGRLTVSSQCQMKIDSPGIGQRNDWSDCGERQPSERTTQAKAIADAISK